MEQVSTRRRLLKTMAAAVSALVVSRPIWLAAQDGKAVASATIAAGNLKVVLRDNSQSPRVLSGLASLFHQQDAPAFDAFDPDSPGASAGLNFEHVISGHNSENNAFTPRHGRCPLYLLPDGRSAMLVRKREDDPWAMSSTLKYSISSPHYVDMDFRCTAHDAALFGKRGYAILFFANYMNDVEQVALHFRGIEGPNGPEKWVAADAPPGHPDWNQGGTYRGSAAADVEYDADHNFKLNSWSYDYPRFAKPFYYGRAARGMAFILMFNKLHTVDDEIRFSLFKFKVPRFPRPAWDFQYVIHKVEAAREYGFRARLVWKKFVSPEDCLQEYLAWAGSGA